MNLVKEYDLYDKFRNKIEGSTITLSYELGTHYDVTKKVSSY
jgi:hypothetical protein